LETKSYWTKFNRARISRRRALAGASAGAVGLALAAACGDDDDGAEPSNGDGNGNGDGTPVAGGTYRNAITGDWGTINPFTSVAFGPGILAKVYNYLIYRSTQDPNVIFLDLAESFEQPDEATYLFTLRANVMIPPNGLGIPERALDSSDCTAWLDATVNTDAAVAKRWTDVWLDTHTASTPTQFELKTKGPYSYLLTTMNTPVGGMIPPKEMLELEMEAQAVGAGPYMIEEGSFVETGGVVLVKSPTSYYTDPDNGDAPLPYIDRIETSRISDRQPRRTAFVDRQIDAYDPETIDEVNQLRGQFSDLQVFEDPAFTFVAFTMNPTREPWTNDQVRMAANFALDRQEYVDVIVNGAGRPNGLVHWPLGEYALPEEELAELQPYDPERARSMLEEAGVEVPLPVTVIYPSNSDIQFHNKHLPIWLEQMNAAGFQVQEDALEFGVWLTTYQNVDYDASLSLNQVYETPEVNLDFHSSEGPTSNGNFAIGVGELYPEIDTAIEESKGITDPAEHVEKVREVQRMIYERGPAYLPIMSWTDYTVRHGNVKNWPMGLGAAIELFTNDQWLDQ
jgi:peptide/nickel transport system substrate-binding protein